MRNYLLALIMGLAALPDSAVAADHTFSFTKLWTHAHSGLSFRWIIVGEGPIRADCTEGFPNAVFALFDTWRDVVRRPVSHVPRRGWHTAGRPAALVRHARLRSVPSIFQG